MAACTRHSDRDTLLSCSSCDRPFCFQCLVQGPVGSKCRDCTNGVAIGAGKAERAKAAVRASDRDRFLSLKIAVAAFIIVNGVMFNRSGSYSGILVGAHRFSVHSGAIRNGQWWRLFTGAVAGNSYVVVVFAAAAMWWVGRMIAPRLGPLQFWAIVAVSLGGGVLSMLALRDGHDGYGGLSIIGGFAATYAMGRRRSRIGALSLPFDGRIGFGIFLIAWIAYGSVSSDPSLLVASGGGAVAAAPLAYWMFAGDRAPLKAGVGAAVAVLLFALSGGVAAASNAPKPPAILDQLGEGPNLSDPFTAPTGWMTVTSWEDEGDVGDLQSYRLRCSPTPEVRDISFGVTDGATSSESCDWLASQSVLTRTEGRPAACSAADILVWRTVVAGEFQDKAGKTKSVQIDVRGSANCTSSFGKDVSRLFG